MKERWHILAFAVCSSFVGFACAESDRAPSQELMKFSGSGCLGKTTMPHVMFVNPDGSTPPGACVVSRRKNETLRLDLLNVRGPCLEDDLLKELPWHPILERFDSAHVVLAVEWPSDKTPACGACSYDFSFEVGPGMWSKTTELDFELRPCPGCQAQDSRRGILNTEKDQQTVLTCGEGFDDGGAPAN